MRLFFCCVYSGFLKGKNLVYYIGRATFELRKTQVMRLNYSIDLNSGLSEICIP